MILISRLLVRLLFDVYATMNVPLCLQEDYDECLSLHHSECVTVFTGGL